MSNTTTHLTDSDIEVFGAELDQIRDEVLATLGQSDARYIRRLIAIQRSLEAGGRMALLVSLFPPAWFAGTAMLATAKILDNIEIGHGVIHGQWDWMRDPRIHSTTWEWDMLTSVAAWKHAHNDLHHTWTNVVGKDRDLGYTILRVSDEQPWHPRYLAQPLYHALFAPVLEWGLAIYELEFDAVREGRKSTNEFLRETRALLAKATRLAAKDYLVFPLLSGPSALPCLLGNLSANVTRNVWMHTIIFLGHFHENVETFTEEQIEDETRGAWYLRQLLGSANMDGNWLFHIASGNLSHQIEHHLFPDLPNNRYAQIAPRVRALCEKYRLPYTTGPFTRQYVSTWKRILRYAFPTQVPRNGTL